MEKLIHAKLFLLSGSKISVYKRSDSVAIRMVNSVIYSVIIDRRPWKGLNLNIYMAEANWR